eukprot:TRINITY_DN24941_c0_g2_i1.p3 TRINITY_DN24941_c0_g2~~TRINITY_DN24941_c0_g2_i1.p3  ORF type:complete len:114 (+),score=10.80 TRINITY_DN24941_c0_g2_i1:343-684(+)
MGQKYLFALVAKSSVSSLHHIAPLAWHGAIQVRLSPLLFLGHAGSIHEKSRSTTAPVACAENEARRTQDRDTLSGVPSLRPAVRKLCGHAGASLQVLKALVGCNMSVLATADC